MADSKYGRLFTEEDAQAIIRAAMAPDNQESEFSEVLDQLDEAGILKFPEDEPLFVLRGQDQLAPQAVHNYSSICAANAVDPEQQAAVHTALANFKVWQRDNPNSVKLPD